MLFQPLMVAPGVIWVNESGLRDRAGADAEIDRQGVDLLAGDRGGLLAAFRLEQRRFRADLDRLGGGADLQGHVDAGCDRHLYRDIGAVGLLKPGCSTVSLYVPTGRAASV